MSLYTQTENDKLAQLLNLSNSKEADYQAELLRNNALKNADKIVSPFATKYGFEGALYSEADYNNMLNASTGRLPILKQAAIDAKAAYEAYKQFLIDSYQQAFNTANPTAAVQIAASQAQAAADTAIATAQGKAVTAEVQAKAELEAQNATFAAKNKQAILYVGIGLTVIIVVMVVYFKFVRKAKP